ncbi:MAG: ASCH domain-containing protein [Ramlibacter sp.]|nr:ASCH domain-containing protein [Ramlibacter sp.]
MRAISLWQPWATAAALGSKRVETRHWATAYRGPLLIHAAKRCNKTEMRVYGEQPAWRNALRLDGNAGPLWEALPLGAVVAVCNLIDCRPSETFTAAVLDEQRWHDPDRDPFTERMMGNFEPQRYGWVLADVHALREPIPYKGGQSFFDVPRALVAEDLARWEGNVTGRSLK